MGPGTSAAQGHGTRAAQRGTRERLGVPIAALLALTISFVAAWLSFSGSGDLAIGASLHWPGQTPPTGEQLIHRMERAAIGGGSFHERIESTTVRRGVRETVVQTLDVDLRHHRLRQIGVDRRIRLPGTLLHQEAFERISVGYRSGTRNNGSAWSCQTFQPGHVRLIGPSAYLAGIGGPRRLSSFSSVSQPFDRLAAIRLRRDRRLLPL